jgi:hypothetical protein
MNKLELQRQRRNRDIDIYADRRKKRLIYPISHLLYIDYLISEINRNESNDGATDHGESNTSTAADL